MLLTEIGEDARAGVVADFTIDPKNMATVKNHLPARYTVIRLDPNNTCNLHCVYCHNARSTDLLDLDDLQFFLDGVISVAHFQIGCGMEPTLDKRLTDVMLLIANSPARPTIEMILQTNGILIHRHDYDKMKQAGLRRLAVSIDAASPQTQKSLRDGTSLDKVVRNVSGFIEQCPNIPVDFITTVTSENVNDLEGLVQLGLDLGVTRFVFREMFYYPDNKIVDHSRMPGLMLKEGQFLGLVERITALFETQADLIFATADFLHESSRKMHENAGVEGQEARGRPLRAAG